jgi:phosphoesterase RecJ-like protein
MELHHRLSRELQAMAELLKRENGYILATHQNPDGDAIGSLLASFHILRWLKKNVWIYFPHELPHNFSFLPGSSFIQKELPSQSNFFSHLLLLDCGSPDRVHDHFPEELKGRKLNHIVVDHHRTERPFADVALIDPEASATGEIIFHLAHRLCYPIGRDFATCIYTAIFTDTGSFRFSNTTAESLEIAASLVRAGADPQKIAEEVYENQPEERLRLLAHVLNTLEVLFEGRVALITIRKEFIERYHQAERYIEGFVDYPRSLRGVVIAIQIREIFEDKEYKLSMRSKGVYDAEAIARRFGGGGHQHAAGCTLYGSYKDILAQILRAVEEELKSKRGGGDSHAQEWDSSR